MGEAGGAAIRRKSLRTGAPPHTTRRTPRGRPSCVLQRRSAPMQSPRSLPSGVHSCLLAAPGSRDVACAGLRGPRGSRSNSGSVMGLVRGLTLKRPQGRPLGWGEEGATPTEMQRNQHADSVRDTLEMEGTSEAEDRDMGTETVTPASSCTGRGRGGAPCLGRDPPKTLIRPCLEQPVGTWVAGTQSTHVSVCAGPSGDCVHLRVYLVPFPEGAPFLILRSAPTPRTLEQVAGRAGYPGPEAASQAEGSPRWPWGTPASTWGCWGLGVPSPTLATPARTHANPGRSCVRPPFTITAIPGPALPRALPSQSVHPPSNPRGACGSGVESGALGLSCLIAKGCGDSS